MIDHLMPGASSWVLIAEYHDVSSIPFLLTGTEAEAEDHAAALLRGEGEMTRVTMWEHVSGHTGELVLRGEVTDGRQIEGERAHFPLRLVQ